MRKILPLKIRGKVVKGSGDGKKIGVPTANIKTNLDLTNLKQGVYSAKVRVDAKEYLGVAHYGPRAVFNETNPQLEVHIPDFDQDIYGKVVEIELTKFQRPTMKFGSVAEMMEQIEKDILITKENLTLN